MPRSAINLSQQQLESLSQKITAALDEEVLIVGVSQCEKGANGTMHFVAESDSGACFGLKSTAPTRGVVNGTEKERLVAEVAELLDAPAFCKTVAITIDEIASLRGRPTNLIKWLTTGVDMGNIGPTIKNALTQDPTAYLRQYGQWMCVGMLLGVRDRHSQQWVWSHSTQELTMVDNEDCLHQGRIQDFYPVLDLVCNRGSMRNEGPERGSGVALAEGLRAMHQKLRDRQRDVWSAIRSYSFAAGYKPAFMGRSPDEIVTEVFVGLA